MQISLSETDNPRRKQWKKHVTTRLKKKQNPSSIKFNVKDKPEKKPRLIFEEVEILQANKQSSSSWSRKISENF